MNPENVLLNKRRRQFTFNFDEGLNRSVKIRPNPSSWSLTLEFRESFSDITKKAFKMIVPPGQYVQDLRVSNYKILDDMM
mmetsp:Transcript_11279/g.12390  ORF Transcript_11279/g.12390 Transcript_11279/m.12390 type:complete len:80 (+) Transcript_11279:827-1066(+)